MQPIPDALDVAPATNSLPFVSTPHSSSGLRHLKSILPPLLVFAGYYLGSLTGFALTFRPFAVSTLWPTNAILLAALLLTSPRRWPLLIASALPAHLAVQMQSDVPMMMVFCWFVSNITEALIGAGMIRVFINTPFNFDSLRSVAFFLSFAVLLSPFLSSFLDAAFVAWNAWGTQNYWHVFRMRLFSNILAALTLVPFIVSICRIELQSLRRAPWQRYLEGGVLLLGLSVVAFVVYHKVEAGPGSPRWIYLPLPFLLWSATRFGFPVLSTSIVIVTFLAIWGAVHGQGPFAGSDPVENALSIQMFLIVFSFPLILFASVLQERKRARESAIQNEERLRLALSAARMSTWELDLPAKQVTWLCESGEALEGEVHRNAMSYDSFLKIIHAEDRSKFQEAIALAVERAESYEVEFRFVQSDGNISWQLGKGQVTPGEPQRVVGILVDITYRKRADEEQRQAEVLAQAHREELYHLSRVGMLGELSGTIAHELNQPLTAILSNAQAAQLMLEKDKIDLAELRAIVNDVVEQNRRAGRVINRVRAMLKKSEVERRPVDLNDIIREVLNLTNSEFVTHRIQLTTQLIADLPKFPGDRVQLQQVLLNLILNAVESMSAPLLEDRRMKIATSLDSMIHMEVFNNGPAIPEADLSQIFEPFYSTKKDGLGLGLLIARSIAAAHGGQLTAKNNPGGGVTFQLSVPVPPVS